MAGRLELTLRRHPPTGGGGQVFFVNSRYIKIKIVIFSKFTLKIIVWQGFYGTSFWGLSSLWHSKTFSGQFKIRV